MDGNKRTGEHGPSVSDVRTSTLTLLLAFFLANEYLRAHGHPGLLHDCKDHESLIHVADRHINAAAGQLDVEGLVGESTKTS